MLKSLRVFWIQNVPNKPVYYPVKNLDSALVLLDLLAESDLLNPDITSNAGGLEIYYPDWGYTDEDGNVDPWTNLSIDDKDCFFSEMEELGLSVSPDIFNKFFG